MDAPREVFHAASALAQGLGESRDSGHLLLITLGRPELPDLAPPLERLRLQLLEALQTTPPGPGDHEAMIDWATVAAEKHTVARVGLAHALLRLLDHDCRAHSALQKVGLDLPLLRERLQVHLDTAPPRPPRQAERNVLADSLRGRLASMMRPGPPPKPALPPRPFPPVTEDLRARESAQVYAVVLDRLEVTRCRMATEPPGMITDIANQAPAAYSDHVAADDARRRLSRQVLRAVYDPKATDYVSTVGFGEGYAVLEAGFVRGPCMGQGFYFLLERVEGEWVIREHSLGWIS